MPMARPCASGDAEQADAALPGGVQILVGADRARANEDERERADEFSGELLRQAVHGFLRAVMDDSSARILLDSRKASQRNWRRELACRPQHQRTARRPLGTPSGESQPWRSGFLPLVMREKFVLNALGDRSARAAADLDAVDRANRSDFGGGAAEENFVRDVKHLARDHLLGDRNSQVAADAS